MKNIYRLNHSLLKQFLKSRRYSQAAFANFCKVRPSTMSLYLNGHEVPGPTVTPRIIGALSAIQCPESMIIKIFPGFGVIKEKAASEKEQREQLKKEMLENDFLDEAISEDDNELLEDIDL